MVQGTARSLIKTSLSSYQFICQGSGIEWPELDYHLSIESMLLADIKNHAA